MFSYSNSASPQKETVGLFDTVLLKDGREGTVVEIYTDPEGFVVEVADDDWGFGCDRSYIVKIIQKNRRGFMNPKHGE